MSGAEVMLAMTIASTAMTAASAVQQGNAQASADKFNAKVAQRNAVICESAGQRRQRIDAIKQMGAARAGYGASGVTTEGSPLEGID